MGNRRRPLPARPEALAVTDKVMLDAEILRQGATLSESDLRAVVNAIAKFKQHTVNQAYAGDTLQALSIEVTMGLKDRTPVGVACFDGKEWSFTPWMFVGGDNVD